MEPSIRQCDVVISTASGEPCGKGDTGYPATEFFKRRSCQDRRFRSLLPSGMALLNQGPAGRADPVNKHCVTVAAERLDEWPADAHVQGRRAGVRNALGSQIPCQNADINTFNQQCRYRAHKSSTQA